MNPAPARASPLTAVSLPQAIGLAAFGWCLFGELSAVDLLVAVGSGALAACALGVVRTCTGMRFRLPVHRLPALAARMPRKISRDLGILGAALTDAAAGRVRHAGGVHPMAFDPGGDRPDDAARRALALAMVSLPPNSIALTIAPRERTLIVHQLVRRDAGPNPPWPP